MNEKVRRIFLPFLIMVVLYTASFTFLNWFLIVKNKMFDFSPVFICGDLNFFLAWIPVLIWLRPRIALLDIKQINRYLFLFLYQLAAVIMITGCIAVSQRLLYFSLHGFQRVATVAEANNIKNVDFFEAAHSFVYPGVHNSFRTVLPNGKDNDSANLGIFIACPVYASAKDTVATEAENWLGLAYTKPVSAETSNELVPFLLKRFDQECESRFQKDAQRKVAFYEKLDDTSFDAGIYQEAAGKSELVYYGDYRHIFIPHYESYPYLLAINIFLVGFVFIAIMTVWLLMILFLPFKEQEYTEEDDLPFPQKESPTGAIMQLMLPDNNYIVTQTILYINIFMFLVLLCTGTGFFSFPSYVLHTFGGSVGFEVLNNGEWWRLLSYAFLHKGVVHFTSNMFFLVLIGYYLEPLIGRLRFSIIYGAAMIIAGLASAYFNWRPVSIGASGAIFGLYGVFFTLIIARAVSRPFPPLFLWLLGLFMGVNFLLGFLSDMVDNAAHLGGLATGVIFGFIFLPSIKAEMLRRKQSDQEENV